ncbi:MAG TPA: tetratricopeptide repeat protein, partial [Candidatus Kapabacteria bacterium]|nr:tetratricopeptide repeat protein [Candidatus Kapabacteria bacterium]
MPEKDLSFKVRDDLKELVRMIGFLKERGGFLLLGTSGPEADQVVEAFLTNQLKEPFHLKKVLWRSGIKELAELFPLADPIDTVYLVNGLEVGLQEDNGGTLTLLNLTREFYTRHKKIVVYCLPTDIVYKEIQWKAVDFWSFRTASFDFFLEEDYRAMLKEKVAKDLEGYERDEEKVVYLEDMLKEERAKEKPDKRKLGGILSDLGVLYGNHDKYKDALKYFEDALSLYKELGDKKGESIQIGNIGLSYQALGQSQKALIYLEEALAVSREIGYKQGEANQLGNIGVIYSNFSQPEEALKYLQEALVLNSEIGNKYGEANQLVNIGVIYQDFGQPEKALKYYKDALSFFQEL